MSDSHRDRLISMLEYLEHWDKLNRKPTFDVAEYNGLLLWEGGTDGLPGISFNSADESGEAWMTIQRLKPVKAPKPGAELIDWVIVSDDPKNEPHRRESLPDPENVDEVIDFDDDPERETGFVKYVEGPWSEWSAGEIPRRDSIAVYDKLFNLLQSIETEGADTAQELVWGIGVAVWKPEGNSPFRHPLISRLVEIDPIGDDMALRIRPRDMPPMLETDAFAAMNIPGLVAYEKAARTILERSDNELNPFEESSFEQILAGAAGTLDKQAVYWPRDSDYEEGKVPPGDEALKVTNTWVIFARRKSTNFLLEDVRRLKVKVEEEEIPEGAPTVMVRSPEGAAPVRQRHSWRGNSSSSTGSLAWGGEEGSSENESNIRDLYFPKPFNAEQVQIIDRLENSDGVVVQGPPGTGKTHTIANVICHYLAEGKRVLVTSKGESALQVLRDQLPESIRDLTVSLLTNEREGLKQLEKGVTKITTDIVSLDSDAVRKQIAQLERRINTLHQNLQEIDRKMAAWAKHNIEEAPPSLGSLKPAELAREVSEQTKAHEWFPDALDSRPEHELQVLNEDMDDLKRARREVGEYLPYLNEIVPAQTALPDRQAMGDLHALLLEYEQLMVTLEDESVERLKAPSQDDLADSNRLEVILNNAESLAKLLREASEIRRRFGEAWPDWLRQNFAEGDSADPAFAIMRENVEHLRKLDETRRDFIGKAIVWEDEWDDDEELITALHRSANGKSSFGILKFRQKNSKQRYQKITINGQAPQQASDWALVERYVTLRRESRSASAAWNALGIDCPAPPLPASPILALKEFEGIAAQVDQAERWVQEIIPRLNAGIASIFMEVDPSQAVDDPERMLELANAIDLRVRRKRLENAKQKAETLGQLFKDATLPLHLAAQDFFGKVLGNENCDTSTVESKWSAVVQVINEVRLLENAFDVIHRVTTKLEDNGASKWARQLTTIPADESEDHILRPEWRAAWKWRRQHGHLLLIDGRQEISNLCEERSILQGDLTNVYANLVEQLTCLKLKETLENDRGLMASLQQYMVAIRGIGRGTGVGATRHRGHARKAMARANNAVRCWIMPHWRVSEGIPSELALFDLVILDEASQSDMWALPSILRAKKLLVVGDNKQVSPSAIGVKNADIQQLHNRFLQSLPFGDVLSPEKSIYDLASVMFASDLVRLREHFRCAEPIIQFSNHLCYHGEIKCLRVPTATERLTPPLIDVFVKDGVRSERGKTNKMEAQAIVNEISALTAQKNYGGRSIGVVSLLGGEQAALIRDMLVEQIGEEEIIQHGIRCGDAMTFQGREADIVMISMVSDIHNLRALSGAMFEQRFNVAASRAKDRLYLFRSFKREDVRETDLRAKLLDHFSQPIKRDTEQKGRNLCESDFERAVYDRLNHEGYRILPQVPAGAY
jgi:hypothetical protein